MTTDNQLSALRWLSDRGGDGMFGRDNVLIASGDRAPVMRSTWSALESEGLVEFYNDRRRARVTDAGRTAARGARLLPDHDDNSTHQVNEWEWDDEEREANAAD